MLATQEEVNAFVDDALSGRTEFRRLPIRPVTADEAEVLKGLVGKDYTGYVHEIDNDDLRHAMKKHSDAKTEAARGQEAITPDDLKRIPEILTSYDSISPGDKMPRGQGTIYQKRVNGNIFYVEMVHEGQGVLRSKTMWKEPSRPIDVQQNAFPDPNVQNGSSLTASTKSSVASQEAAGNSLENTVKGEGDTKFKRDLTPEQQQDLRVLETVANQRKIGPLTLNKVELAPEAIDRLIANVKQMVSADDTIISYMRDWEVLRQRIREEVATPYFKDAMGEKQFTDTFGSKWQETAAKAKERGNAGKSLYDMSDYRTSSGIEIDKARPEELIAKTDGTTKFGEINSEDAKVIRRQSGEIKLQVGRGEYGLIHIADTRTDEIIKLGYDSIPSFVEDVASGYDRIFQGDGKTILLVKTESPNKRCVVELKLDKEGEQDFYSVLTAFPARESYLKNKGLLLQRNEPSVAVPTTAPALRTSRQYSGDEPPIVRGRSSPNSSLRDELNDVNLDNKPKIQARLQRQISRLLRTGQGCPAEISGSQSSAKNCS